MKILIIGAGGREQALAWKLRQSPRVSRVFCLPGNGANEENASYLQISLSDLRGLRDFAVENAIDFTVVGPDEALANGIVDLFQTAGLRIFGPNQAAARLESSKIFAKEFMQRHGLPTARSGHFQNPDEAREFLRKLGLPVVIKADGLALGKGVIIAQNPREASMAIYRLMERRELGEAGAAVVIEEFLHGPECSIHALVDGKNYLLFPGAQDHKRAFAGDLGPNTGGMGTCSPVPFLDEAMLERVKKEILDPFMVGLAKDGIDFQGMLFPGLIMTADGPKLLEFNCRFGDPETQVLLPRLQTDLLDLLEATVDRRLADCVPQWDERAAICVVLASGGYPGKYPTGLPIRGLSEAEKLGALVFQAGTKRTEDGLVTAGGRVLGVTALEKDLPEARETAYRAIREIEFAGSFFRNDIGAKLI